MSVGTIQIPVLFDMSGSSVVYGEDATGADFVDSHLQFLLDMTTEANGISLNASDISSAILVADQDTGDNIFFDGHNLLYFCLKEILWLFSIPPSTTTFTFVTLENFLDKCLDACIIAALLDE